ncbi:histidine phosphatase superfamily [Limtongia smithiae]|uniref:histidine phosphatase superfamily n=1 Tax=Limtongia smithiae TaxID=1125753 RepID=UPI0034CE7FA4
MQPKIDRVYSSPFYRCLQTINGLADSLDLEIYGENGFGEWYGRTRDSHPRAAPPTILKSFFRRVKDDYEPITVPSIQGETLDELHQRAETVLQKMIDICNAEAREIKTVLICAHAATVIALGRALVGDASFDVRTGTCSIGLYESRGTDNKVGMWECKLNGFTEHLQDGEERHWSFEDGHYDFLDVQAYQARVDAQQGHSTAQNIT